MSKSIFASVTFWGAVVAMLSPLLKHFGFALTADDQSSIIGSLATLAGQAAPLVGGVIAIIGRLRASKTVHIITPRFSTPLAGSAMLLFCLLVLPLSFTGCAKKAYSVHPGAINTMDSVSYDALTIAQGQIDDWRPKVGCEVPVALFDGVVHAYNIAESSWQLYHAGGIKDAQLAHDLQGLMDAIAAVKASPPGGATPCKKA